MTSGEIIKKTNCSYRQLNHWRSQGWLKPETFILKSRHFYNYSERDLSIIEDVTDLMSWGVSPSSAFDLVKNLQSPFRQIEDLEDKVKILQEENLELKNNLAEIQARENINTILRSPMR